MRFHKSLNCKESVPCFGPSILAHVRLWQYSFTLGASTPSPMNDASFVASPARLVHGREDPIKPLVCSHASDED